MHCGEAGASNYWSGAEFSIAGFRSLLLDFDTQLCHSYCSLEL
jgi:hypothetical protein